MRGAGAVVAAAVHVASAAGRIPAAVHAAAAVVITAVRSGGEPVDVKPFNGAQTLDLAALRADALADELRRHGLERRSVRYRQQEAETSKQSLPPARRGRGNHLAMR